MPTIYGYIRVSSDSQADSGLSLDSQQARIRDESARLAKTLRCRIGDVFRDPAVSATRTPLLARTGGAALDSVLHAGDHVVIAKLDRAFRSQRDCVNTCESWISRGVTIHILDLGVDTATPTGRMMMGMLSSIAQWEAARIGERIRDAMAENRRRGRPPNGRRLLGYRLVGGKLQPFGRERQIARKARRMRENGMLLKQIAQRLNAARIRRPNGRKWTHQAVARLLFALSHGWPNYTMPSKIAARRRRK
jgi:DNA invertase Pin-like site-specific DNA recombinase